MGQNTGKHNLEGRRRFAKQTPTPTPPRVQTKGVRAELCGEDRQRVPGPTFALEVVGGRGEQQPVHHGFGAAAAGDPRLLVARLDPLGEPAQVAVAVQGVGAQSPRGAKQLAQVIWQR